MRSKNLKQHLRPKNDGLTAFIVLVVVVVFSSCMPSCISMQKPSAEEPNWEPDGYKIVNQGGFMYWVNEYGHRIMPEDPALYQMILLPLDQLTTLGEKMNRCEQWQ